MTRSKLKRVIFVAVLSFGLIGCPAGSSLMAQEDISNRNELLSRIKLLRKHFETANRKFTVLKKRYEALFAQAQRIEENIEREKQKITEIKARRIQEQAKRDAQKRMLEENIMRKAREAAKQQDTQDKKQSQSQRRKVIEQLLRQLEAQKQK